MKAGYLSHSALFSWCSLHLTVNNTKHLLPSPCWPPRFTIQQSSYYLPFVYIYIWWIGYPKKAMRVKVKVKSLSHVWLFATPWTVAHQAPPSMGFSRQEYWSGFPFPSPGDLPDPGIEPRSPALQANALTSESPGKPKKKAIKLLKIEDKHWLI